MQRSISKCLLCVTVEKELIFLNSVSPPSIIQWLNHFGNSFRFMFKSVEHFVNVFSRLHYSASLVHVFFIKGREMMSMKDSSFIQRQS